MEKNPIERIEKLINENGLTMKAVSLAAGKNETFVRDMIKRGRSPSVANLDAVEKAIAKLSGQDIPKMPEAQAQGIPNLDIHAGMGNGGLGHIEIDERTSRPLPQYTDGDWLFPPSFMQRLGTLKGKYAMPVEGDSMAPTIAPGSVVFVDTARAYPSAPGLYVVDAGDGRLVKRVELIAGTDQIAVMSDNPSYRNYEFDRESVQIFGRVIAIFSFND